MNQQPPRLPSPDAGTGKPFLPRDKTGGYWGWGYQPTLEQAAEAISQAVGGYNKNTQTIQNAAAAVLALIQNGDDR